jgi:hypothetical protein
MRQSRGSVELKGLAMKKYVMPAIVAAAVASGAQAFAADLKPVYKAPAPEPAYNPWDIAFGAGIASDYNFRGISQSARQPSLNAYFEPRYNFTKDIQGYAGIGGYSITFPNRASAEVDLYGGLRLTFDKLALDLGLLYYWYPGGQCFFGGAPLLPAVPPECNPPLPNGNYAKRNASFLEYYGKATYTFNDNLSIGGGVFHTEDWLNTGAQGTYANGTLKITGNALPSGWNWYVSGEYGHYWLGTTDAFYGVPAFPAGSPLPDYSTWNVGIGFTYKVFTIDLRYYDTDLSKEDCNVLTSDHTATNTGIPTLTNPAGLQSKWCGAAFIGKLSIDATLNANIK